MSAKVGRNEWLWQTLDNGNMFMPILASKIRSNFNVRNKNTIKLHFS